MSQISPPIRIVLVAAIGLLAAWMLFLRPSGDVETTPPAAAPGVTGLSNAVDKAKDAAAAQQKRDAEVQKATGEESAPGGKSEAAQETSQKALLTGRVLALSPLVDEDLEGLPKAVSAALARRDVVAIGVFNTRNKPWAPMAADDRRVRRALRDANRYGGRVTVHSATLRDLTELRPVIGNLNVSQSPSVVVVDRNRKATVLEGYVDRVAINQAIADARRNTIAFRVKNRYLSELNTRCTQYYMRADRFEWPKPGRRGTRLAFDRAVRLSSTFVRRFGALKPTARYKGLHADVMRALRSERSRLAAARGAYNRGDLASVLPILAGGDVAALVALDKRFDRSGVTGCVSNRRS